MLEPTAGHQPLPCWPVLQTNSERNPCTAACIAAEAALTWVPFQVQIQLGTSPWPVGQSCKQRQRVDSCTAAEAALTRLGVPFRCKCSWALILCCWPMLHAPQVASEHGSRQSQADGQISHIVRRQEAVMHRINRREKGAAVSIDWRQLGGAGMMASLWKHNRLHEG